MRLRTLTILLGLSLGLLLLASLYVGGPGDASRGRNDGVVRVHFADNISPAHTAVIARFNELHAGSIEVIPVDLPFEKFTTNERKELLARSLRSKSEKLDVFAVDLIWVPRFARWAEPLGPHIARSVRDDILPTALESCVWNDTLVALPMYIDIGLLYYRRDIIRSLPDGARVEAQLQSSMTWDDLVGLRQRLGYARRPFYVFQGKDYEGLICNFLEVAMSYDPAFVDSSSFPLDSPSASMALLHLSSFVRSGVSPAEVVKFDENDSYRYFLDTDAVFVRGWPNFVENFRTFYGDSSKLAAVGRAPLPHVRGSAPTSVYGGWNLMLSRASSKKREAAIFIEFLQSEEAQRILFERGGYIPINSRVYENDAFMADHPELTFYHELLNRGFHRPALVDYTKTSDVLSHYLNGALAGQYAPDEALRQARNMIATSAVLLR